MSGWEVRCAISKITHSFAFKIPWLKKNQGILFSQMVNTNIMGTEYEDSNAYDKLTLDIRSINNILTSHFQRYSIALNKLTGGEILGKEQIRKV